MSTQPVRSGVRGCAGALRAECNRERDAGEPGSHLTVTPVRRRAAIVMRPIPSTTVLATPGIAEFTIAVAPAIAIVTASAGARTPVASADRAHGTSNSTALIRMIRSSQSQRAGPGMKIPRTLPSHIVTVLSLRKENSAVAAPGEPSKKSRTPAPGWVCGAPRAGQSALTVGHLSQRAPGGTLSGAVAANADGGSPEGSSW